MNHDEDFNSRAENDDFGPPSHNNSSGNDESGPWVIAIIILIGIYALIIEPIFF